MNKQLRTRCFTSADDLASWVNNCGQPLGIVSITDIVSITQNLNAFTVFYWEEINPVEFNRYLLKRFDSLEELHKFFNENTSHILIWISPPRTVPDKRTNMPYPMSYTTKKEYTAAYYLKP